MRRTARRRRECQVDFLRFGGFAEAEIRLGFLLGRLERGEGTATALRAVYGMGTRELDRELERWVLGP